ncbi:MAG: A/G-specific adenine glycosylase [Acidimicrobiia bacterium]|nr:A/G-specific adenine glycosylase [Acidimicrobiia bacterium]
MTAGSVEAERNAALLGWYRANQRVLPWRATTDPYAVLVAETMLQQTQAARVVPYYQSFLARFPDVTALAAAPFAAVAAAWSGLGYNRRARWLHRAAQRIAAAGWPDTVAGLEALPGVGGYTARAVAVFAFGHRDVTPDTNLKRVLSRWYGEPLAGSTLRRVGLAALDEDAASWNQAVMDLGNAICRPYDPACDRCPVERWCTGPDVYQRPATQSPFPGSVRQVRGVIVRLLIGGPLDETAFAAATNRFPTDQVEEALDGLIEDGLVVETEDGFAIAD